MTEKNILLVLSVALTSTFCGCAAERVEDDVLVGVSAKGVQVLPNEVRWIAQDEAIPSVDGFVFLSEPVLDSVVVRDLPC